LKLRKEQLQHSLIYLTKTGNVRNPQVKFLLLN